MSAVDRLVRTFDLDGDGGLAAFYHGDLLVVALDRLAVKDMSDIQTTWEKKGERGGGGG